MPVAPEGDADPAVAHALAVQAVRDAGFGHQIDRALFEHAGADALDHVLPAPVLEDHGIDATQMEQVAEHQPGRPRADDPDLCACGLHDRIPRVIMTEKSDVVGSLLRPTYLLDARGALERGELAPADFKRIEDRAVDEAVALQEAAGLDVVTDGEMRRYAFFGHLVDALEGFDKLAGWSITFRDGHGHEAALERPVVVEKLRWRRQMSVEEFTYLRGRTSRRGQGHPRQRAAGGRVLRRRQVARRVRRRATRISPISSTSRGARSRNCAGSAASTSRSTRRSTRRSSTRRFARATASAASDPDRMLDACIELDNAIIAGHPGMTFGIHICRGNHKSMFYASGGYDRIAAQVFRRARFDRFLLEYDDERSGTFEPLRHVPDDRVVVLGLVSSKKPRLESRRRAEGAHRGSGSRSSRSSGWRSARSAASRRRTKATPCRRTISGGSWSWSRRRHGRCGANNA